MPDIAAFQTLLPAAPGFLLFPPAGAFTSPGLPGGFSLSLSVVLLFWYALPPPGQFSLKYRSPGIPPVSLPDTQKTGRTAGSYMVH